MTIYYVLNLEQLYNLLSKSRCLTISNVTDKHCEVMQVMIRNRKLHFINEWPSFRF